MSLRSYLKGALARAMAPRPAKRVIEPPPTGDPDRIAQVQAVLSEMRPMFLRDGGDMRLVAIEEEGVVLVRLVGACHGCGVSTLTLEGAVKPKLREHCDWFRTLKTLDD